MAARLRRGFTLVELLVVISIIAMLMAIIIPAIQFAKESAKRSVCSNNQRQLAMGVLQYHETNGRFPGYANTVGPGNSFRDNVLGTNGLTGASWAVVIFPYVGRGDIWDRWDRHKLETSAVGWNQPDGHIDLLICPSDPPRRVERSPWSYAVNAGFFSEEDAATDYPTNGPCNHCGTCDHDPDDPSLPYGKPYNGVFFNHFPFKPNRRAVPGDLRPNRLPSVIQKLDYLIQHDGMSSTIMLSENLLQDGNVIGQDAIDQYVDIPDLRRLLDAGVECDRAPTGAVHADFAGRGSWRRVNSQRVHTSIVWYKGLGSGSNTSSLLKHYRSLGRKPDNEIDFTVLDMQHARPSSRHQNGVNIAYCDAHVKFYAKTTHYSVYQQLMSPYTSESTNKGYVGNLPVYDEAQLITPEGR